MPSLYSFSADRPDDGPRRLCLSPSDVGNRPVCRDGHLSCRRNRCPGLCPCHSCLFPFRIPKNRSATTILSLAFSFLSFLFVLILSFAVIDGENADAISDEIQAVCSRLSFLDWTVFLPRKAMLLEDGLPSFPSFRPCFVFPLRRVGRSCGNLFYRRKLVETGKKKKRKEDRNVRSEVEKAFLSPIAILS